MKDEELRTIIESVCKLLTIAAVLIFFVTTSAILVVVSHYATQTYLFSALVLSGYYAIIAVSIKNGYLDNNANTD